MQQKKLIVLAIILCLFFIVNTVYYTLKKESFFQKQVSSQPTYEQQKLSQIAEDGDNQPQGNTVGQLSSANKQISEVDFRNMVNSVLEKEGYTLTHPLPSDAPFLAATLRLEDINKDGKKEAVVSLSAGRTSEIAGINIYGLNEQGQVTLLGEKLGCNNTKNNIPDIKYFSYNKIGQSELLDNGISIECKYAVTYDPEGYPSIVYKEYYEWDGQRFVFTTDEREKSDSKK